MGEEACGQDDGEEGLDVEAVWADGLQLEFQEKTTGIRDSIKGGWCVV